MENTYNEDANETVFFARQLEHVKAQSYDKKYPAYKAQQFIPVNTGVDEGAKSITYESYDGNGQSKFIADYADDLPNVEVSGTEFTTPVRQHGNEYQFSNQELRASRMAGKNLPTRKADRSRQAYEQIVDDTAWLADGSTQWRGLTGILYNPSVNIDPAPNGTWASATPDQIIADVNFAINNPLDVTNGVEMVDTCLLSVERYTVLSSTRLTDTGETILSFLQKVHPGVTFDHVAKFKDITTPSTGTGTTNIILTFKSDPSNLTLEIPMPYTQHPAQPRNLAQVVPTEGSTGGVIIYYPLSVQIVEGI